MAWPNRPGATRGDDTDRTIAAIAKEYARDRHVEALKAVRSALSRHIVRVQVLFVVPSNADLT